MKFIYSFPITLVFLIFFYSFTYSQNQILSLDGDADYAFANDDTSFSVTDAVTVAAWVKINSNGTTSSIARKGATQTPAYSLNKVSGDRFTFWIALGSWVNSGYSSTIATIGEWYHVAGVYDGSEIKIYVNGDLEASNSYSGAIPTTTDNFYIGVDATTWVEYFNGSVEELSVWSKALTEAQIQTVMNDSLSAAYYQTNDSGLVAYWKFNELEDLGVNSDGTDDVRDLSINGNHIDLQGDSFIEPGGPAGVELISNEIPVDFCFNQNYPNPFNPITTISFSLPQVSYVSLKVFNALGEEIEILVSEELSAGNYQYDWNAINLPSGIYFYKLQSENFVETKKMILLK
jgi:hypothetical protein